MKTIETIKQKYFLSIFAILSFLCFSNIIAQDFWTKLHGPEGGRIWSSAVDRTGGIYNGTIFHGTYGGGIYRSTDNGNTWLEVNEGIGSFYIFDIVVGSSVYAATNGGIYRSDDNGNTWQLKNNGLAGGSWWALVIDQSGGIFAGNLGAGVYYSTDNGENWSGGIGNLADGIIKDLAINNAGELFASGNGGVHRSTDNGASWTQIVNGLGWMDVWSLSFFQNGSNENIIAGTSGGGVFISQNNGDLWQEFNNGLSNLKVYHTLENATNDLFLGTQDGVFKSYDFGLNWVQSGINNEKVHSLVENNANNIFAGTRIGNFRSLDNGSSWNLINTGFISGPVKDLDVHPNNMIFVLSENGVSVSSDNGISWLRKNNGLIDTTYKELRINDQGNIFVGTAIGIYRSDNNGDNWAFKGLAGDLVQNIVFNTSGHVFAGTWGTIGGIYRSEDNGDSWTHLTNLNEDDIPAIAINHNDNTIFAGEWGNGVFRSSDNGDTWTPVNNNLTNTQIRALAINDAGDVFAGTEGNGIFRSHDNGDNWVEINTGLFDGIVRSICINSMGHLYIGTENNGIFFSNDNGDNWIPLNGGMPYPKVFDLALNSDEYFLAATSGGMFMSVIPSALPQPLLSLPIDGETGIELDPVLQWNSALGATSYEAQVNDNPTFNPPLVWSLSGITNLSEQAYGLSGQTTYYWRVRGDNFTGSSGWSDVWSFTTYSLPLLTTQDATNVTNVSAELNAVVNPNGHQIVVGFEYGEDMSYGTHSPASPDTISGTIGIPVSARVTWLSTDTEHHYRVIVSHLDGSFNIVGNDKMFYTGEYPATIDVSTSVNFPSNGTASNYQASDYRLVGLPGQKDDMLNITRFLTGEHGTDWQAYWDNGTDSQNASDYLVEYNGSDQFKFGDGNALWIINKGNMNVNEIGIPTVPLNVNDVFSIVLHPGWNIITNPYDIGIAWWEIQQYNSFGEPLYSFDGSWQEVQNFNPYEGYYFDNTSGLNVLEIPYAAILPKQVNNNLFEWQVGIHLTAGDIFVSSTSFGVSKGSDTGRDKYDFRKPRAVGAIPSVYFYRPEWDDGYGVFATDIRPEIQEAENWNFNVSGSLNQKSTLTFSGIEDVPKQHDIYLLDETHSVYINLRDKSEYSFVPVIKTSDFSVLVGNQETIFEELENLIPTEFKLGRNFPNPFNPSTIIPVSIPKGSKLTLKVYDVLGQEIRTIYDGTKDTGKHYFRWDGTNYLNQQVAAGIYLYRLNTSQGHVFVGKMVLVK